MALPDFDANTQARLKDASVLVVGCGGLGCPILLYLVAAGVGKIGIVDYDIVEEHNLQRQVLFDSVDIGRLKVDCAKEKLQKFNPHTEIETYSLKLSAANAEQILINYDIIADGTDNFPTRYLVNDACVILNKINAHASLSQYDGQVSMFNVPLDDGTRSANYRDIYPKPPDASQIPNCAEGGVLGVLAGMVGTIMANEIIKIITGNGETLINKMLLLDSRNMSTRILNFKKNQENNITKLIDYDAFCNSNQIVKNNEMKEVTVQQLKQWKDDNKSYQLIDVREQHEFDFCNLGGELIPLNSIMDHVDKISKEIPVVVHCRSGARSANAIMALNGQFGFDNLYNLKGGILAWSQEIDPSIPQY